MDTRREAPPLASAWTRVNDQQIFARVSSGPVPSGSPTVVLVHGVIASSRYMVPTAARLARSCRVLVPDLPGYGKSTKPHRALSVPELADVLGAWLPAAGPERAIFVGNSFGCQVVADLAARYPHLVEGAVLIGPTVDPAARTVLQQGLRLLRDVPGERPSLWPVLAGDLLAMGPVRAFRQVQWMLRDPIEEKLPLMRVPTLIVRGSRDPIAPQCWVETMQRLLPEGHLVTMAHAPHAANYSAPAQLVDTIMPFIASVHRGDAGITSQHARQPETPERPG